ncbi:MAG: hypothetical protein AAF203_11110, partial [Pseudomonadota bacterium]
SFLILNTVIVTFLALYFYRGKSKRPQPTKLNMRKTKFQPVSKEVDINDEEELNVYFMHNGYLWDAYDIIGVPAGSPLSDVEMAYLKSRMRIDEESKEILEMAYNAIHQKQG